MRKSIPPILVEVKRTIACPGPGGARRQGEEAGAFWVVFFIYVIDGDDDRRDAIALSRVFLFCGFFFDRGPNPSVAPFLLHRSALRDQEEESGTALGLDWGDGVPFKDEKEGDGIEKNEATVALVCSRFGRRQKKKNGMRSPEDSHFFHLFI